MGIGRREKAKVNKKVKSAADKPLDIEDCSLYIQVGGFSIRPTFSIVEFKVSRPGSLIGALSKIMKHGSLFSGIGGFDLAAQWMGWENVFHCEYNPFCQRILKYYWPRAQSYGDIKKTDFTRHYGTIDLLSGGFPCQPYSSSGKRLGTEDDRHLWPEMLRAIREISPRWIVGENVRGLTNWNGGVVFDEVQADLEAQGYEVLPFLLPASAINAPHRRDRIWFIAHSKGGTWDLSKATKDGEKELYTTGNGTERDVTHTGGGGQQGSGRSEGFLHQAAYGNGKASWSDPDGGWPLESPVCPRNDGIPTKLDGITLSHWREQSLSGGGNAIVPQVALQIFKAIYQYESIL